MKQQDKLLAKKRGRPATGINQTVGVRMTPAEIDAVDAWRATQPGIPTRPEAIRRLVEIALSVSPKP
jgi:hypothetical protein